MPTLNIISALLVYIFSLSSYPIRNLLKNFFHNFLCFFFLRLWILRVRILRLLKVFSFWEFLNRLISYVSWEFFIIKSIKYEIYFESFKGMNVSVSKRSIWDFWEIIYFTKMKIEFRKINWNGCKLKQN